MKTHVFRLHPGQDLKKEIQGYAIRQNIAAGWIMTCVGSLSRVCLRFAKQQEATSLNGPFEIISLVGTISINGSHLHLGVADGKGNMTGGHLLDGNSVFTTAEIVLAEEKNLVFRRVEDSASGWRELSIEANHLLKTQRKDPEHKKSIR